MAAAAGANTPSEYSQNVYIWMGHGNEIQSAFRLRGEVPPGKIIVLFAEYGDGVSTETGKRLWEEMYNNPHKFENPGSQELREQFPSMRIYYPGDKVPKFIFYPLAIHNNENLMNGMSRTHPWKIQPSGVFKLDMDNEEGHVLPSRTAGFEELQRGTTIPWNSIMSGNINKNFRDAVKEKYEYLTVSPTNSESILEGISYKSEDLLKSMPDGIHYFVSCRYIKGQVAMLKRLINELYRDIDKKLRFLEGRREGRGMFVNNGIEYSDSNENLNRGRDVLKLPEAEETLTPYYNIPTPRGGTYTKNALIEAFREIKHLISSVEGMNMTSHLSTYDYYLELKRAFENEINLDLYKAPLYSIFLQTLEKKVYLIIHLITTTRQNSFKQQQQREQHAGKRTRKSRGKKRKTRKTN